ncbi:uncharacterized protein LOC123548504 [Mercenaria mercenaria]|uniref:uncharacterized protein LOC123548504 n=1 Tax=Mercenaria mercenaria TaxID=6596 RepID=UPI00234EFCE3|nr:uncharacterized protein LOC123548504 [Mercenaria mercenaria]
MSLDPDYRTVSLKLSEVLNDTGVSERMVLKRRRMYLLMETMQTSIYRMSNHNYSHYHFGSKSEGSTTIGLKSDIDSLICYNDYNVIKDWTEWQPGSINLLMIKDETTSPGYCLLQHLGDDKPLPSLLHHRPDNKYHTFSRGKVLWKNTAISVPLAGSVKNGPATSLQGRPGLVDDDVVLSFHCKSWPVEAQPWLVRQGVGRWPTEKMKKYCETTGCFVVPVGSKSGLNEEVEWRISTCHAERCLMFNLNITQLRCYTLMKMILKTFIKPCCGGVLSSYMCKTVLFHCIQNKHSNNWRQSNLLACLMSCLKILQNFVRHENCPHFIIPENNLMAVKISPHNKHKILEILQNIIQCEGHALLEIPIDDLGRRLQAKMNMDEAFPYYLTPAQINTIISTQLLYRTANLISNSHRELLVKGTMPDRIVMLHQILSDYIFILTRMYRENGFNSLEKSVFKILTPLLSFSLGSVIASQDINTARIISHKALSWFSVGLNSDVASGRLKLASALYCVGDMERTEIVLRNTEEKYDLNTVEPVCGCYPHLLHYIKPEFLNKCNTGNEELLKHITAFCVRFLPCEINCVPEELKYEMFRSTQEDMLERDEDNDCWMDWAVVDSLPYLYFLQYKTYGALQRVADKQRALANLVTSTETEANLGHRETALNLLGQCMEQENQHIDALHCYMISLNIQARNNAANILICRLLNELVNMQ